ncbi:helix-turn-helix transcriptional regulator [Guptibacillus hwajinpoensis]|uniref:helix-turn-helix transcriptional regulator n=1 Tax=Guptibacillus hwajinpoensis TaxID=208199 RepID=UPI0024B3B8B1|nr:helix-turn-helix transcriptional regulator [Pseudalkalibacillus hwajinpoensis]
MTKEMVKQLRVLAGFNQRELASSAGVSQTLIALIETGDRKLHSKLERKLYEVFGSAGIGGQEIALISDFLNKSKT